MQKLKGLGKGIYGKPFWKKKWLSEMLSSISVLSLKQFMGVLDRSLSPLL